MPNTSKNYLLWLREIPGKFSTDAFLKVIENLDYIRRLTLKLNTKGLHPNRIRQLSRIRARYEPFSFLQFHSTKESAIIIADLIDLTQYLVTQAFKFMINKS